MKQLKKKSNDLVEEENTEGSDIYSEEDLSAWDVTLSDGLDELSDEEVDEILQGEIFVVEDEDETLEDFTEDEIQSLTNEIPEEVEEPIEEILDTNEEGEFVFEEGPYTFETDEEVAEIESKQEDLNVGMGSPVEEVTEAPTQPIRLDEKQIEVEDPLAFRKGPLWQYRTNNRKND
jgi:hypothetical protein